MAATHSPRFVQICEQARARITEISADELVQQRTEKRLEKHLGEAPGAHLIDVREDHEWALGHIPGAVHLGRGILERDIERLFPDVDTEIVLYCGGGYRSALAARSLQEMGYTRVRSLAGGFRGWQGAGRPVQNS
jgi:rhodanese-related sulfurtransferase